MIKRSLITIVSLVLIIGLNWTGLSALIGTLAFFNDDENSSLNSFEAATLDFHLNANDWSPDGNLLPEGSMGKTISLINDGSLIFQYKVKAEKTAGNDDFCNALQLTADLDGGTVEYMGKLLDFDYGPVVFSAPGDWNFVVSLPNVTVPEGASCEFKFVFSAWQQGLNQGEGFSDMEEDESLIEGGVSTNYSSYSPIADSYVGQGNDNANYGSDHDLKVRSRVNDNKRTFIKFDFLFPSGTSILSSNLKLFMYKAPTYTRIYQARKASADWTEMGIKWNNQPAADSNVTSFENTGIKKNVWLTWDVTSDVQGFVNASYPNYGWRINDAYEDTSSCSVYEAKFISKDGPYPSARPVLEVSFVPPVVTTTYPVVNEVYTEVAPGKGNNPKNEWVEIYNPSENPIDISNWKICDDSSCDTIPASSIIPSKGFAVVTGYNSTWNYWTPPAEAIKIVLNSNIGGGLTNAGDRVILKDLSNNVIDAMSYGSDTSQLNPSVYRSGWGRSLARIVKGYDSDKATDWIINVTPNPGTNPTNGEGIEAFRITSEGIEVADSLIDLDQLVIEDVPPESEVPIEEPATSTEPIIDQTVVEDATNTEATTTEPIGQEISEATSTEEVIPEGSISTEIALTTEDVATSTDPVIPSESSTENATSTATTTEDVFEDTTTINESTSTESITTEQTEEPPVVLEESTSLPEETSSEQTEALQDPDQTPLPDQETPNETIEESIPATE